MLGDVQGNIKAEWVFNFIAGTTALTLQYFAFSRDWPMLPSVRVELSRVDYTGYASRPLLPFPLGFPR